MNPSVQELSSGMDNGQYEKYIILPNNKNIILAAQQLQKMLGEKVHIVPSTNPMEGLAAAMAFSEDQSLEDNLSAMNERMGDITTAMITTAVRDSIVGNAVIHKDDFMGIMKNHEVIAEKDFTKCFTDVLSRIITEDTEIVTVYSGKDLSEEDCLKEIDMVENSTPM